MKIGCLGPGGTFSQLALRKFFLNAKYEEHLFSSIQDLILGVDNALIDYAVVPIENSLEGAVNTTLDALAESKNLVITEEFLLGVHHNLLSNTEISKIKKIYSHPQPVGQCAKFINKNLSGIGIEYTNSTADAAKFALEEEGSAAIGSEKLAKMYKLNIIESGIEDNNSNTTRFIIIGRSGAEPSERDKTSIVFSVDDRPGSLYKILSIFDIFEINMIRIESRPQKTVLGKYLFFVDIDGNTQNINIKKALELVEYKTSFYKNLGSYKKHTVNV